MKYAILADIHANLGALTAVLEDIRQQGCKQILCLGDVVGYGSQPKECVDVIRSRASVCVKGNHDEYCSEESMTDGFNPRAAERVVWTREQLDDKDREWLAGLAYTATVDGFTLVHASLDSPGKWPYVFDKLAAAASFSYQQTGVCFFGHTHVPVTFARDRGVCGGTYTKFKIDPKKQYFINPGSVGQPRDNNPKAAYVVYDRGAGAIELRRIEYTLLDNPGHNPGTAGFLVPGPKPPLPSMSAHNTITRNE